MLLPETLEEALKQLKDATSENRGYRIQMDDLLSENNALKESVASYEALAEEENEYAIIPKVVERIEMDCTAIEGKYQLAMVSVQCRDVFMEYTDKYLKMLNG